ncbi:hypothetical protein GMO_06120 [Gluconobacter morbifer G707]|uniref:Uncharacterized protein n=1 Tax=Gluconobacter morbifer G707 TaxID=1088869 RepID=G6XGJ7_9PROT|nr:hypothetical protein GMO_06120 [Gluconobacter morbifer G707]
MGIWERIVKIQGVLNAKAPVERRDMFYNEKGGVSCVKAVSRIA